jgi:hypothetical protein
MKKIILCSFILILLLLSMSSITGCKKDSNDPVVPDFTVTYTTVNLQGGGEGVQFSAKCNNTDVIMQKVTLTNPTTAFTIYQYTAGSFSKNELFGFQESNEAYIKLAGNWKFNLVGTAGGTAFAVEETLAVSK